MVRRSADVLVLLFNETVETARARGHLSGEHYFERITIAPGVALSDRTEAGLSSP
jgi:hypothetical protein